jgi:hypothetical protein
VCSLAFSYAHYVSHVPERRETIDNSFFGTRKEAASESVQKLGMSISSGRPGLRQGCAVCYVRWSVPAWGCCHAAFAVTRGGYLEHRDAAGREFPVQNRDPNLRQAARPFVSPEHLSLLGQAVADDLIHRGLGDAAGERALAHSMAECGPLSSWKRMKCWRVGCGIR